MQKGYLMMDESLRQQFPAPAKGKNREYPSMLQPARLRLALSVSLRNRCLPRKGDVTVSVLSISFPAAITTPVPNKQIAQSTPIWDLGKQYSLWYMLGKTGKS